MERKKWLVVATLILEANGILFSQLSGLWLLIGIVHPHVAGGVELDWEDIGHCFKMFVLAVDSIAVLEGDGGDDAVIPGTIQPVIAQLPAGFSCLTPDLVVAGSVRENVEVFFELRAFFFSSTAKDLELDGAAKDRRELIQQSLDRQFGIGRAFEACGVDPHAGID